jgi:hypothetical protein
MGSFYNNKKDNQQAPSYSTPLPSHNNIKNELGPAAYFIKHPFRLIVTGRSTMGKTTLAVQIILHHLMKDVRRCFAVCPTFWNQPALAPLRQIKGAFNKSNVFTEVNDEIFEYIYKVLERQPAPTLIYVDDAAAEHSTNRGSKGSFARLAIACNHLDSSMVGVFQRLTTASPAFRDNVEGIISFIPSKIIDVDTIIKEFNPCPTSNKGWKLVRKALNAAWRKSRFCFIYRQAFTGSIFYFSGFNFKINFAQTPMTRVISDQEGNATTNDEYDVYRF